MDRNFTTLTGPALATENVGLHQRLADLLRAVETLGDRIGKVGDAVGGYRPSPVPYDGKKDTVEQVPHLTLLTTRVSQAVSRCQDEMLRLEQVL
jgi:hypothetical protein